MADDTHFAELAPVRSVEAGEFQALLKGQEVVVENTATGKALIAVGEARGEDVLVEKSVSLNMENTATGRALIAIGEARGEVKGLRTAILDILDLRGITVPAAVRARLEAEADLPRLLAIRREARKVGRTWPISSRLRETSRGSARTPPWARP